MPQPKPRRKTSRRSTTRTPAPPRSPRSPRSPRFLETDKGPVEIRVVNNARSKNKLTLRVDSTGQARLTVSHSVTDADIDSFLGKHADWLRREIGRFGARTNRLGMQAGGVVWYLGEPLRVVRVKGARSKARRGQLSSGEIVLAVSGPPAQMAKAIEDWYREQARSLAAEIIAEEAPKLGVTGVKKIRIGDMKTRWGSANPRGTISLCWRLLLAPPEMFDYVVVHEICHFLEWNHSKRFWAHVARQRPEWRSQRDWLNRHGHELQAWTPELALRQPDALAAQAA